VGISSFSSVQSPSDGRLILEKVDSATGAPTGKDLGGRRDSSHRELGCRVSLALDWFRVRT